MTPSALLARLTSQQSHDFLTSPADSPELQAPFIRATKFDDEGAFQELQLALDALARDREYAQAIQTLESFRNQTSVRGVEARRMLHAYDVARLLPEEAHAFLDAFAAIAARCLQDSKSRAGRRRGQLLKDLLAEASSIEERRVA